jgi:hypothetical protein
MKKCYKLLHEILSHKNSWPFRDPVDPEALGVPGYFDVITHPMDLSTIDSHLRNNDYKTPEEFATDVRLVWSNAITFNTPGDFYYKSAERLSKLFEKKFAALQLGKKRGRKSSDKPFIPSVTTKRGRKKAVAEAPVLTYQDKAELVTKIGQLTNEELVKVVNIVKESRGQIEEISDEDIEIDVDALDNATLYRLLKYTELCFSKRGVAPSSVVMKQDSSPVNV